MAIQVRLDLTPHEFDILRAALDSYIGERISAGDNTNLAPQMRRLAKADALKATDLASKLR